MIDVGMDFGNAYTIISIYRKDIGQTETLNLGMASANIPSVAALDKGSFKCGVTAKGCIGKENVRFFDSFKRLLTKQNREDLCAFGFDETYTPEKITRIYIEEILKQVLVHCHAHVIDHLAVAVPEMWYDGGSGADGCKSIRHICSEISFVRHVQVISEPVASSIFFAQNFRTMTGEAFDGHMLIVDHGAKNLDLTLLDISGGKDQAVSAEVLEYTQDGENDGGSRTYAGSTYVEKLLRLALAEMGAADIRFLRDGRFLRAVAELEKALQTKAVKIEDIFEEYGIDDIDDLERLDFADIDYGTETVRITYGQMLRTYRESIAPVLGEKLDEMIYMMKIHNVCYEKRRGGRFKIAVTGGFGSFYLVQKQIRDRFAFNSYDQRQSYLTAQKNDAVCAVSKGAALIASGTAVIPQNAPYSIGVLVYGGAKKKDGYDAIRCDQPLTYDKIYYAKDKAGEPYVIHVPSGSLKYFRVNAKDDRGKYAIAVVKQSFAGRLEHVIHNETRTAVIGFSVDPSGILSLHIYDYDVIDKRMAPNAKVIELARFEDVFEVIENIKGGDGV